MESEANFRKWIRKAKIKELPQRLSRKVQPPNPQCFKYTSNRQNINENVTQISLEWSCIDKFQMHLT